MNEIVKKILYLRGIEKESDIEEFLSDKPRLTYNPELLPDIDEGTNLILEETAKGSRILIYGDYDADGITSTALMYTVLSELTDKKNLSYYIPSRFDEGYGLNKEAVKNFKEQGIDFIITVDCGSVSYDEVELAKELGIKILVTDHHNITDKMASCLVINPKRSDSNYPFKELSGCGVAFKVCQMLSKKANLRRSLITEVLDLVLIGTVGDIMPLIDENRTFVKYGLRVINNGKRKGLNSLIERIGLVKGKITSENVGYAIVPHLNASGRIYSASQAVELMLTEDDERIEEIVTDLIKKNRERKEFQEVAYERAVEIIGNDIKRFNIIRLDGYHEGILGIVAGKLKDTVKRPVVIVSPVKDENRLLKGTGRSIETVDIYECLKKYENLFLKFGGHKGACGFTIEEDKLEELRNSINNDMLSYSDETFESKMEYDLEISASDLTYTLAKDLKLLEPFGKNNKKPKFKVALKPVKEVTYMGKEKNHMKFGFYDVQFVLFNKALKYDANELRTKEFSVIGCFDYQVFRGSINLQFIVDEISING